MHTHMQLKKTLLLQFTGGKREFIMFMEITRIEERNPQLCEETETSTSFTGQTNRKSN